MHKLMTAVVVSLGLGSVFAGKVYYASPTGTSSGAGTAEDPLLRPFAHARDGAWRFQQIRFHDVCEKLLLQNRLTVPQLAGDILACLSAMK